jgi:large subunit ribosomal protein L22
MQIRSIYRGARISAFKCREVTREIQGLPVAAALDLLNFTPRKAARLVEKTLKSAIANAENNANLRSDKLVVKEAVVGEGPTFKRFQPKARGSAGPIRKRTSHIRIIVTDEVEIPTREKKSTSGQKKAARPVRKKTPAASAAAPAGEATTTQE